MREIPSDSLMDAVFDHLSISHEKTDIWNDNVNDETINEETIAEVIEHYTDELKEELIDEVESMSGEGQARTFGMWYDERSANEVREILVGEGKTMDEATELLEDYDDDDIVGYVVVLYGDIDSIVTDERAGAERIVEDAIEGEQWDTLAKVLIDL